MSESSTSAASPSAVIGTLSHLVIDCQDPNGLAAFWCQVLGTTVHMQWKQYVMLEPLKGQGLALAFQQVPEAKTVKNRMHLDFFVPDGQLDKATAAAVGLGAVYQHTNQDDGVTVNVMHDPEGNEFCLVKVPNQPSV